MIQFFIKNPLNKIFLAKKVTYRTPFKLNFGNGHVNAYIDFTGKLLMAYIAPVVPADI